MFWQELLERVAQGEPCDARGCETEITGRMVEELLAAAPRPRPGGRPVLTQPNFAGLTFRDIRFCNVAFEGDATFAGARFTGKAHFVLVHAFRCSFRGAAFEGHAYFDDWQIDLLDFRKASFAGTDQFINIRAHTFDLTECSFEGNAIFYDLRIGTFFNLIQARFAERVLKFVAGCRQLQLDGLHLARGGTFFLHGGEVFLAGSELKEFTLICGTELSGQFGNIKESLVVDGGPWRPRLGNLDGVDVGKLMLADVDLSRCFFRGTFGLEELRLEGTCLFGQPPTGVYAGLVPPAVWWWSRRQVLFEERVWRSRTRKRRGWVPPSKSRQPGEPITISAEGNPFAVAAMTSAELREQADHLAKLYRALRRGQEDVKNEPGAADFYYGEMEMRRLGSAPWGERFILWLYWLVSGYGLRPLRTLLALAALTVAAATILSRHGFVVQRPWMEVWPVTLAALVDMSFLDPAQFTIAGNWVRIALRVLGPILVGFLLLALRGRVKR